MTNGSAEDVLQHSVRINRFHAPTLATTRAALLVMMAELHVQREMSGQTHYQT